MHLQIKAQAIPIVSMCWQHMWGPCKPASPKLPKRWGFSVSPNKQAFIDNDLSSRCSPFQFETACPTSKIWDILYDSKTHCLILRQAVWVWDRLSGLGTYCLRVESCEIKTACSVSTQLYPRSWLLIISKQACGNSARCLSSHTLNTENHAMHLVILPGFSTKIWCLQFTT